MVVRLELFLSGLWYRLLCQFKEYKVSYDNDDDLQLNNVPLQG